MRRPSIQFSVGRRCIIHSNVLDLASFHSGHPLIAFPDQSLLPTLFHERCWQKLPSPLLGTSIRSTTLLFEPINGRQQSHATTWVTPDPSSYMSLRKCWCPFAFQERPRFIRSTLHTNLSTDITSAFHVSLHDGDFAAGSCFQEFGCPET